MGFLQNRVSLQQSRYKTLGELQIELSWKQLPPFASILESLEDFTYLLWQNHDFLMVLEGFFPCNKGQKEHNENQDTVPESIEDQGTFLSALFLSCQAQLQNLTCSVPAMPGMSMQWWMAIFARSSTLIPRKHFKECLAEVDIFPHTQHERNHVWQNDFLMRNIYPTCCSPVTLELCGSVHHLQRQEPFPASGRTHLGDKMK